MHQRRIEEANGIAVQINREIVNFNNSNFRNIDGSKDMWKAVNTVLGKSNKNAKVGIDPVALNTHYASVSTDAHHLPIEFKSTCLKNAC